MKINKYSQLHGIMPTFQYTTWKTKNFCTFKNLINNKKSEEDTKIGVFKVVKTIWRKEIHLKVDPENKMVPQLWLLWWISRLWNNWRGWLQVNVLKKIDFESESPSVRVKVCCHYNRWVNGVCIALMLDKKFLRKNISDWAIILIKFKALWLL